MHKHPHDDLSEVLRTEREILRVEKEILRGLPKQPLSRFSAVRFSGDKKMADNVLVLDVGQTSKASPITYLADGVTPSGATYSGATWTFSDPSATVVLNPDGVTATVTGVAPSSAAVSGSVAFTATDTDGAVSTWTQDFTITTNGVTPPPPPAQLSQSSAVQFTPPA